MNDIIQELRKFIVNTEGSTVYHLSTVDAREILRRIDRLQGIAGAMTMGPQGIAGAMTMGPDAADIYEPMRHKIPAEKDKRFAESVSESFVEKAITQPQVGHGEQGVE